MVTRDTLACAEAPPLPANTRTSPASAHESANLDLLRSFAVIFVFVSHLPRSSGVRELGWYHLQALGFLGVALFFVHTTLVLMLSLDRQQDKHGRGSLYFAFLVRRIFRVYPLSTFVVSAAYITALAGFGPEPVGKFRLLPNLLLIQNLTGDPSVPSPLWSLPFEMQMYLVLPALWVLSKKLSPRIYATVLWPISVATVLVAWRLHLPYQLIKYVPCFLPGVLAYMLLRERGNAHPAWLVAFIAAWAVCFPAAVKLGLAEHVLAWAVCLAAALLIPQLGELRNERLARAAKFVATYSYGIYLVHTYTIWLFFEEGASLPLPGRWLLCMGSTIFLSVLLYHTLEAPLISFGNLVAKRGLLVAVTGRRDLKQHQLQIGPVKPLGTAPPDTRRG